jgi:arylsulfatase A-like enzyme
VAFSAPHYPLNESAEWVQPYKGVFENPTRRRFAGAMTHMDDAIGRILAAVEESGTAGETLVLFLSDNGAQDEWPSSDEEYNGRYAPHTQLGDNTPLRGWKVDLYEGGIRVPAVACWPGRLVPRRSEAMLSVYDVLPTLAGLAGVDLPAELEACGEGSDAWPALVGEPFLSGRTLYIRTGEGVMVRRGDWKLIHKGTSLGEGSDELYNIAQDPTEEHDLAPIHPKMVDDLRALLAEQMEKDGY